MTDPNTTDLQYVKDLKVRYTFDLALLYMARRKTQTAIELLDAMEDLNEDDRRRYFKYRVSCRVDLALIYNENNEKEKAVEELNSLESVQDLDDDQKTLISDAKNYVNGTKNGEETQKDNDSS